MNKVIYIADFLYPELVGGGELNDYVLINELITLGYSCSKIKSRNVTIDYLQQHSDCFFIVGNFIQLNVDSKQWLIDNANYIIYEHDHKYLSTRDPGKFVNFQASEKDQRNFFFYKNADKVICQSKFHKEIVDKNLGLDNVVSIGGNLWSNQDLDHIMSLYNVEKDDVYAVLDSNISHKNTQGAIRYCKKNNLKYRRIKSSSYHDFLRQLAKCKGLVFLPKTPETFSRLIIEARMLGLEVITNDLVGATHEEWFAREKGHVLQCMMRGWRREQILETVTSTIKEAALKINGNVKVSIIATFLNSDGYLEEFLDNIVNLNDFEKHELVLVDAASEGDEQDIIKKYQEQYSNITNIRIEEPLNTSQCFNIAIKQAKGKYIALACLDDIKYDFNVTLLSDELDKLPFNYALTYGDVVVMGTQNKFEHSIHEFSKENMIKNLPGPMPLWRKSIHDFCGFFDEKIKYPNDWDMWLRFVEAGFSFKKINKVVGEYKLGGVSTQNHSRQRVEEANLFFKHNGLFGIKNYNKYYPYFKQFLEN